VSQAAWRDFQGHDRLRGPLTIDTIERDWGDAEKRAPWDSLYCANMVHIAPFAAAEGLIAGAGRVLRPGGRLMLYGPFARNGDIAPSNARFSDDLKRRDPSWGVRDLDQDLVPLATQAGLQLITVLDMPANNLSVVFERF
jgi:SAM-dependent methyltransferase